MTDLSNTPKWKKFEEFVAYLQSHIASGAIVKHNDKIKGKSGTVRQIDVSIRYSLGQFNLFLIIDCKDWKKPVDIADVGAFVDMVEDVEANKGAIVCNAGFTRGAKNRAKEKGIDLFVAFDSEHLDLSAYIAFPTLCDFSFVKHCEFCFKHSSPTPFVLSAIDPKYIEIFDQNHVFKDILINLFFKSWNSGKLSCKPGKYDYVPFIEGESFVKTNGVYYGPVDITVAYTVDRKLFYGETPIQKGAGFGNVLGESFTSKCFEIKLDVENIEKNWRKLNNEDELAIKPTFRFNGCDCYPLIKYSR